MPSALDLTPEKRFMGLFIGPSGHGKTCAEASFPKPIKFLDFDGRIRGLLGAPWINRDKINYSYYPPRELGLVDRINQELDLLDTAGRTMQTHLLPQTLVLDSLTSECFAMIVQSIGLTHSIGGKNDKKAGKYLGSTPMAGPEDYGFEATNTYSIMSYLRSLPIPNIIVSAHVVNQYGKIDGSNPYSESVVIGEKLSVRDKIGENIQIYFDHVFRFKKELVGDDEKFFVRFRGDLARTSYTSLPTGWTDITGKSLYETMMIFIKGELENVASSTDPIADRTNA